jgi:N-acetylneuraminic acid mutarotase
MRFAQLMMIAAIRLLLLFLTVKARAQSALDSFDPNASGAVRIAVVQPHSKILIAGDFTTLSPNGGPAVTRNRSASQPSELSLADRVAYQRAIEEVYWRHRIWPKERPDPKPSLDEMMPPAQIEQKVEDYLRTSQALEDYWQQPVSAEQLQAEMERMAEHTQQPDVLRELFAALGNDPFIIAECLARPALSERLVTNFYAHDQRSHGELRRPSEADLREPWRARAENQMPKVMAARAADYTLPTISETLNGFTDDTWTATSTTNAPTARALHTAVWTGSEMIVWGGQGFLNTGGRYNPGTDSWTATSTINAPTAREVHTAIWTGSEMIVWGGYNGNGPLNTGGRYNPGTDSWTGTSTTNAPTARVNHTAVWMGGEMIVWGGNNGSTFLNTGGRYNPGTDSWTGTSTINAPTRRAFQTAVWTGSEMIVWGGLFNDGTNHFLNTGGRYNPGTDSWTVTSITNAPVGRSSSTAVWTSSEMILWGGYNGGFLNTGGRYNPSTDSWTATSATNAPTARYTHTAVWTGIEMILWGGTIGGGTSLNTGGRYNPSTDSWTATSTTNASTARFDHTAVWTGSEMIVWGGADTGGLLNTGGRYCAQPSAPIVQSAASRKTHGGAGTFDVNLPLSGTPGIECRSGGTTNDYTIVVTFLANVSVNGSPQAAVTAGSGTVGSGGVSNGGMVTISGNVVTIPLTNVANAQTINVTLNSVNGSTNVTIPMSILIGDANANGTVNAADVAQTKGRLGQTVDATNFRSDVNANGSINAGDVSIIKANLGTGLP